MHDDLVDLGGWIVALGMAVALPIGIRVNSQPDLVLLMLTPVSICFLGFGIVFLGLIRGLHRKVSK